MRIPYTQQFSPEQTPAWRLIPILRQHQGDKAKLRAAIGSAFFKGKADPQKLAGNTVIALRAYGIIDKAAKLAPFGQQLLDASDESAVHRLIATRLLLEMGGISIVETIRDMARASITADLVSLPKELRMRGVSASDNSSDLSGALNWLRAAGVLDGYEIVDSIYRDIVGASVSTLNVLGGLTTGQIAFLRAMVALNVTDWQPYNSICKHAEELYPGEIRFNWKDIVASVLAPLTEAGLIELRKKAKQAGSFRQGRGGKPADVRPTRRFTSELADPLLTALYASAGFSEIRKIRSLALSDIVNDIEQNSDQNKRGKALEMLAIRICQMLDLDFMGWRETDVEVAGGGEVDALLHSSRLIYSRWQIQCKVGPIAMEAIAKEVGMQNVSLANVILVVGTKKATDAALTYRRKIVSTTNLNIIILDGPLLRRVINNNSDLVSILRMQAQDALRCKPAPAGVRSTPPSGGTSEGPSNSSPNPAAGGAKSDFSFNPAYSTALGSCYCGDALELLPALVAKGLRTKLIVTSPPFALVRKKDYGNEDADNYVRWFERFIPLFKEVLQPDGSLVIDIGGAWIKGLPVKSTYHFKLLIRLCESGFFLAQDFYHYNPARLPTPAEWVTVRRLRVKDSVNNVWWLTLDPFVRADNRRVLRPYSEAMKYLLKNGYKPAKRPSGHDISHKFQRDNQGAIPPNVLEFANTESNSHYLRRCKDVGIKAHPARYPDGVPAFFIEFLTDPGDMVLDPFAGSNVTGAVAESLGRHWIGVELDRQYVEASKFRFERLPTLGTRPATSALTSYGPEIVNDPQSTLFAKTYSG